MGGNSLLNILIQTIKAKMTSFVTKFRMYTSWSFIKTRLVMRIRDFFMNLLGVKPRDKNDYFTIGRWMISKRLVYAGVLIIGVISIWYITTETSLFRRFDENGIKTYKYNSVRLRTAKGHVRIKGRSGYRAYDGNVADGYVTGSGTLYNPQGNVVYTGNFERNKYEGQGIENYADGNMHYQGGFHENLYEGNGILYREDGTKEYEGEFLQGKKNGHGLLYDSGDNEIYEGSFSSDNIVYSELLGKTAAEVNLNYMGPRSIYLTDSESVVMMNSIGALYHGTRDADALEDDEKVSEVYVLQDHYDFGGEEVKSVSDIKDIMGKPLYEGYSEIILPEAIAIDRLNAYGDVFKGVGDLVLTNTFSDVAEVEGYDNDYTVYIYSFKRGDIVYSFVCQDKSDYFEFYYISTDEDA